MRASLLHKEAGAHAEGVWCAAWLPGAGEQLLTGSVDEHVKLWDAAANPPSQLHAFAGFSLGAVSLAVDPTGRFAAASALDSVTRVWDTATHETRCSVEALPTEAWGVAFGAAAADGSPQLAIAGGSREAVTVYRAAPDEPVVEATLALPPADGASAANGAAKRERFVLSVAYSPDGKLLAASAMDGTVCVYDLAAGAGAPPRVMKGHHRPVRALAFTPDGQMLLTGCDDAHAHLYDVSSGGLVDAFSGHESWVLSVAVHPGGAAFATASSDARVRLFDLSTRACVQTLNDHTDQVWALAFSGDGAKLASGGDDKTVNFYSVG